MQPIYDQSLTKPCATFDISNANNNPYDQAVECLRELSNQHQVGQSQQIHLFELPDGVNIVLTIAAGKHILTYSYQLNERSDERTIQRVLDQALNLMLYKQSQQEAA